jgi:hypothetical protein
LNSVNELGYPQQYAIVQLLINLNKPFMIIDSKDLLKNPKEVLSNWCESISIDFDQSMLHWKSGNHKYDGIWWKHWYDNVIHTTGFQQYNEKDISIENKYDSIYNESMRYYNLLRELK